MALETAVVRATTPSTTGTVSFTSSGFGTPTAAIFFLCYDSTDDTVRNDDAYLSVGFTDGTNKRCVGIGMQDAVSTQNAGRHQKNACLVQADPTTGGVSKEGTFTGSPWITDGIQLDWTVNSGTAQFDVVCILIKGVSAQVGVATLSPTNNGTVSPSTSFAVDAVFSLGCGAGSDGGLAFGLMNFGCAVDDGSLTQRCASFTAHDNEATVTLQAELSEQAFTQQLVSNARTWYADVTAFNSGSNGFTVTSRGSTSSDTFSYLAISDGGSNLSLQTVSSPTSTGTQNYSVTGTPHTAIGAMTNASAVNTVQTSGPGAEGISIFAAEDGTGEYSVEVGDDDAASTSATWNLQATKLIDKRYSSSGTVTAHVAASVNAWNSGALQLNWTTVDASPRKGWVLIVSDAASGSTITASHIASAESLPVATIDQELLAAAIATGESVQNATIDQQLLGALIASGESVFSPTLDQQILAALVASSEVVHVPAIAVGDTISAAVIASAESLPTATIDQQVLAAAVATAEAVNNPTITLGGDTITALAIASGETLFASTIDQIVLAAAIASSESVPVPLAYVIGVATEFFPARGLEGCTVAVVGLEGMSASIRGLE